MKLSKEKWVVLNLGKKNAHHSAIREGEKEKNTAKAALDAIKRNIFSSVSIVRHWDCLSVYSDVAPSLKIFKYRLDKLFSEAEKLYVILFQRKDMD